MARGSTRSLSHAASRPDPTPRGTATGEQKSSGFLARLLKRKKETEECIEAADGDRRLRLEAADEGRRLRLEAVGGREVDGTGGGRRSEMHSTPSVSKENALDDEEVPMLNVTGVEEGSRLSEGREVDDDEGRVQETLLNVDGAGDAEVELELRDALEEDIWRERCMGRLSGGGGGREKKTSDRCGRGWDFDATRLEDA